MPFDGRPVAALATGSEFLDFKNTEYRCRGIQTRSEIDNGELKYCGSRMVVKISGLQWLSIGTKPTLSNGRMGGINPIPNVLWVHNNVEPRSQQSSSKSRVTRKNSPW
ncbi:hypothetical protein PIB30_095866 [Stylosanthes scabra]|uniref:Uncharacterized protein n=1 Tax=Stylosanthes scabra TaxID=79078 RepID=A0ABU6VUA1_9FABA|nr:hypothetical protein [Stylosanthes scabra]